MKIDIVLLARFLNDANKSTYADKNAQKAQASRLKSEDYHFEKDGLIYHDTYFGGRDFIGGEIVYNENIPVWGMNYYGYVLNSEMRENDVYDFLRKALMNEFRGIIPVRGPHSFVEGVWSYANKPSGDLARFTGSEEISHQGEIVYRADYHGGFIV